MLTDLGRIFLVFEGQSPIFGKREIGGYLLRNYYLGETVKEE